MVGGGCASLTGRPLNHFILNLQGTSKLCVSLKEFYEFKAVSITLHGIYKEGADFAFRLAFKGNV